MSTQDDRQRQWRITRAAALALLKREGSHDVDYIQDPTTGLLGGSYPQGGGDFSYGRDSHPGEGYSTGAAIRNGVIHTDDVYDAVKALHDDRKVELRQPRQVTVLIDKLGEITKSMIAKGEKAPLFDLCKVTVRGTNLFCADTLGIPRVQMPQIPKEQDAAFLQHLRDRGYKVELKSESASYLRATQNQLNGASVANIAAFLRNKPGHQSNPIAVSNDNYILDGHHRWAAKIGLDAEDNRFGDKDIAVARVDIGITKLLEEAEIFTGGKGKIAMGERRGDEPVRGHRLTSKQIIADAGKVKPNSRRVPSIAKEMNVRAGRILMEDLGVPSLNLNNRTDERDDYLAHVIARELKDGLTNGHSAADWYDKSMKDAMATAAKIYPGMASDPNKRFIYTASLAITSQGELVDSSVRLADVAYKHFERYGKLPENIKAADPNIGENFKKMNAFIKEMGVARTREMFDQEMTVAELKAMTGYEVSGMGVEDRVYGSAVLGPKIGNGFYQNLNGNFKPITMDLWFMRSWGRITNTGIHESDMTKQVQRFEKALQAQGMKVPKTNKAKINLARKIFDAHEKAYLANKNGYRDKKKSELILSSERYVYHHDGAMVEMPRGVGQRRWITSVFNRAIDKLKAEGITITPASAQATWWWPEKVLYDSLGGRVRELDMDYGKALEKLAKSRNIKALSYVQGLGSIPWVEDPDEPDYMSDEEIEVMAKKAALHFQPKRKSIREWLRTKDPHHDWMDECVPALMDMGKDQIVAVAACLNMWREAWEENHPDLEDPGPARPGEGDGDGDVVRERARELLTKATYDDYIQDPKTGRFVGSHPEGGSDSGGDKPKAPKASKAETAKHRPPGNPAKPYPKEDDGNAKAGDEILVFRLGREGGGLAGKNGGNVNGVANHLTNVDDWEKPGYATGDTISSYRVKLTKDPGQYAAVIAGQPRGPEEEDQVGRTGTGSIAYSFPKSGAGYEAEPLDSVPLARVREYLKDMGYRNADEAGTLNTAMAIRAAFDENITGERAELPKREPYPWEKPEPAAAPAPADKPSKPAKTPAHGISGLPADIKVKDPALNQAIERDAFTFEAKERPKGKYQSGAPRYEVTVTAKIPEGIEQFKTGRRDQVAYYDPKLADLKVFNKGEEHLERTRPVAKEGLKTEIEPLPESEGEVIYRGMRAEEYQKFLDTGKLESTGLYNMAGQEGLTYWATDPKTAMSYANGFAPWPHKATFEKPAYVVAVRRPPPEDIKQVEGTGENEVGVSRAMTKEDVVGMWRGDVYSHYPGEIDLNPSSYATDETDYEAGGSSAPSSGVVWKELWEWKSETRIEEQRVEEEAKREAERPQREANIRFAARDAAIKNDFNPDNIRYSNENKEFVLAGQNYKYAGSYEFGTPTITLYMNQLSEESTAGVTAHEVAHRKFDLMLKKRQAEYDAIMEDGGPPPDPDHPSVWGRRGGIDAMMKPDGMLRPPYDKKYPLYQEYERIRNMKPSLEDTDGVSPYSRQYWSQWYLGMGGVTTEVAYHETIAEMSKALTKWGRPAITAKEPWLDMYALMEKVWSEAPAEERDAPKKKAA